MGEMCLNNVFVTVIISALLKETECSVCLSTAVPETDECRVDFDWAEVGSPASSQERREREPRVCLSFSG